MLLFDRVFVFFTCLIIGACGFQPLYGTQSVGQVIADFSTIQVAPMPDRIGQQLHNQLEQLLHPQGTNPRYAYRLDATLRESTTSLAVKKSAFATRANLSVTVGYTLTSISDRKPLFQASNSISVSYNIFDSEFESLVAEKDARKRAVRELAQEIRIRLGVFLRSRGKELSRAS